MQQADKHHSRRRCIFIRQCMLDIIPRWSGDGTTFDFANKVSPEGMEIHIEFALFVLHFFRKLLPLRICQ